MRVWFSPKTGEAVYVKNDDPINAEEEALLRRGFYPALGPGSSRENSLFPMKVRKTGKVLPVILSDAEVEIVDPRAFECYEDFRTEYDRYHAISSSLNPYVMMSDVPRLRRMMKDGKYLYRKLMDAIKAGKVPQPFDTICAGLSPARRDRLRAAILLHGAVAERERYWY